MTGRRLPAWTGAIVRAVGCCALATGVAGAAANRLQAQAAARASNPVRPSYAAAAGDDWRRYRTVADLRARGQFWWFREGEDVYRHVSLVPDPRYGQVARVHFAATTETGFTPKLTAQLPRPLEHMWFRWRMRYSPGFTTVGPLPPNYANSYKVAFWLWEGAEGRGQVEISNTDQYILGVHVITPSGQTVRYAVTPLPGNMDFGRVTTEWSAGGWWEFVAHYEKTGPTTARQQWWRRRLTPTPGPWIYSGVALSGGPTPRVRAITLGANRNRSTPHPMYIDWGPWEVVDGRVHPNPFAMPATR